MECFERNQDAYDKLRPLWAKIPAAVKSTCAALARHNGPSSYVILEGCVNVELKNEAAKANRPNLQFKY